MNKKRVVTIFHYQYPNIQTFSKNVSMNN